MQGGMRGRNLKAVFIVLILQTSGAWGSMHWPPIPRGFHIIAESSHHYVLERSNETGSRYVLFDTRVGWTFPVSTGASNRTDKTEAFIFNDVVFVTSGRHRAVAAAHGEAIPKYLGGTGVKHWLLYRMSPNHKRVYFVGRLMDGQKFQLLADIPIRRDPVSGEYTSCRDFLDRQ